MGPVFVKLTTVDGQSLWLNAMDVVCVHSLADGHVAKSVVQFRIGGESRAFELQHSADEAIEIIAAIEPGA